MTIDDNVIIPFYNIDIRLWIFDLFCPKLIHNQYNDNFITHKLNDAIDYTICKKKKSCGLKPADNSNKVKEKKVPKTVNCPASSEKVIAHAKKNTHPQFIRLNYSSIGYMLLIS